MFSEVFQMKMSVLSIHSADFKIEKPPKKRSFKISPIQPYEEESRFFTK